MPDYFERLLKIRVDSSDIQYDAKIKEPSQVFSIFFTFMYGAGS